MAFVSPAFWSALISRPVAFVSCLALHVCLFVCCTPRLIADAPGTSQSSPQIDWIDGPITSHLGDIAEIRIPSGYRFTGKVGTRKFLELTQNPPSGNELGTIIPKSSGDSSTKNSPFWFIVFEFNDVGYVKDDDHDKLDADALLTSLKNNTESANKERANHGWPAYHVTSWYKAPFYDVTSKNLTWAMQGYSVEDNKQEPSVNYSVRILGRRGTMSADLVLGPSIVDEVVPTFESLISGFTFVQGSSYAEFRAGDKVAEYGLATLIVGGATAIAAKTGLLAKLWKVIIAVIAALIAFLKRAWNYLKRVLSGKAADETPQRG